MMTGMSKKSAKIAALIDHCQGDGTGWDPHYLGFFACFNRGLFYEAHDVLEELWLPLRREREGDFYKGLIQLAGAFVLLQKGRLAPAARLFEMARENLVKYPDHHQGLQISRITRLISDWAGWLDEGDPAVNPLGIHPAPRLDLPTDPLHP